MHLDEREPIQTAEHGRETVEIPSSYEFTGKHVNPSDIPLYPDSERPVFADFVTQYEWFQSLADEEKLRAFLDAQPCSEAEFKEAQDIIFFPLWGADVVTYLETFTSDSPHEIPRKVAHAIKLLDQWFSHLQQKRWYAFLISCDEYRKEQEQNISGPLANAWEADRRLYSKLRAAHSQELTQKRIAQLLPRFLGHDAEKYSERLRRLEHEYYTELCVLEAKKNAAEAKQEVELIDTTSEELVLQVRFTIRRHPSPFEKALQKVKDRFLELLAKI